MAPDPQPALLGAQDRQRAQQAAQEPALEGKACSPGDPQAETRNDAESAFDAFIETCAVKYHKAAACLVKDRETMLAFYDFPAEHWKHLRTTNPIESTFATVRQGDHRHAVLEAIGDDVRGVGDARSDGGDQDRRGAVAVMDAFAHEAGAILVLGEHDADAGCPSHLFHPSHSETLEFCITPGYPFRHA